MNANMEATDGDFAFVGPVVHSTILTGLNSRLWVKFKNTGNPMFPALELDIPLHPV